MNASANSEFVKFLKSLMSENKLSARMMAQLLGVSATTVSRWLSHKDSPNFESCRKLADYSGVSLNKILHMLHILSERIGSESVLLPELRDYARNKYPKELDDDIVSMLEDLIRRKQERLNHGK